MAAKNDITGDSIQTRGISEAYRNNYDLIFGKKKKVDNDIDQNTPSTEEVSNDKETTT